MTTRLDFEISAEREEQLAAVALVCGTKDISELINYAITCFMWMVQARMHGRAIASVDKDRKQATELDCEALNNAAAFAAQHDMQDIGRG